MFAQCIACQEPRRSLRAKLLAIKSKSNIYNIRTFQLPFLSRIEWKGKAVAYLEQTDNEIIIASGDGEFFTFKKKDIESDSLYLKKIRTNVKNLIKDQKFYLSGVYDIRDLFILDNKILPVFDFF